MVDKKPYLYDAFISYRHCDPDKIVAEKLHRMLETYKVPRSVSKLTGKKKIQRVFRDRDELPTSSNLAEDITKALEASEYLIVICSPRTPQSQWVSKEIEEFKALRGPEKILALLIEGEPYESFPTQLRFIKRIDTKEDGTPVETITEIEPLSADIRATTTKGMFKNLKTEVLRLLAPLLNCKFDNLKQRHRERLIKTVLAASISFSAFFLAFGSFSTYQALVINQKSREVMQKSQEIMAQIQKTQISQSRYLANISNQLYEGGDRYRAILAAQEALPQDLSSPERPYVPEAEYALSQALHVYDADNTPDMDIVLDHNKNVCFLEMSPDGQTLLTASNDGLVMTWDIETGRKLATINAGDVSFIEYQACFLDDNSIIATTEETTACFDIKGSKKWEVEGYAYRMALSPDRTKLVCNFSDHLSIINATTGEILLDIASSEDFNFAVIGTYINQLAFDKKADLLAVSFNNGTVYIFDSSTGRLVHTLKAGYKNISSLEFSDEGNLIVSSYDWDEENLVFTKGRGSLKVFSPDGTEPLLSMDFPNSKVEKAVFHPYNSSWIVFIESEKLHVIDYKKGQNISTFIHGDSVTSYKIFDTFIFSSSKDGTARFLMTEGSGYENNYMRLTFPDSIKQMVQGKGRIALYYPSSNKVYVLKYLENEQIVKLDGHHDNIGYGCYSSDGKTAVTADLDSSEDSEKGLLCLWDAVNHKLLKTTILGDKIRGLKFVDMDSKILAWMSSGKIMLLNATDLTILSEHKYDANIINIEFNLETNLIAIISYNDVTLLSLKDLKLINSYETESIQSFSFSGNLGLFVTGKSGIKLIDVLTGEEKLAVKDDKIRDGAISPNGAYIALAYEDRSLKLFERGDNLRETVIIKDNGLNLSKIVFSPDSQKLLVGYDDKSISFYETKSGILLNTQGGEHFFSPLESVVFSSNGDRFVCTDGSGNAQIFDAATLKVLARMEILSIDPHFKSILSRDGHNVLFMPLYTTQMLLDEAQKQLNGRILTDDERKTLFIE